MAVQKRNHKSPSVLRRYEHVIGVLIKYGFEDIIANSALAKFKKAAKMLTPVHQGVSGMEFTTYERIRMVCEELGPTYIKFAQIASNRPDLLPDELLLELEKFQDHAVPVPADAVIKVIEEELGQPVDQLFERFDAKPLASASMAQVHRARLIGGKEVVLKVQRPGIDLTIEEDIAVLKGLARMAERYMPQLGSFQPVELVKMFERSVRKELKFTMEMANVRRFERNFAGNPDIYVPSVYPEYTTDRVLCMEYIEGLKITDLRALAKIDMTGPELATKGIGLYFQQVFDYGFFHADPHPGNIFVLRDKRICFIDYGMMGTIIDSDKELLADLLLSVHEKDVEAMKKALKRFSWSAESINEKNLEYDIIEFFENYSSVTVDEVQGEEVMAALNSLFFDYKIKIPSNLLLLMKALVIIEGVGLTLNPKYNIIGNITPFVQRLLARKYTPEKLSKLLGRSLRNIYTLAATFPEDAREIIKKIRRGKLHIEFEHKGIEPLLNKMETISNRIAFTLLLVALLVSSALIVVADVPPKYHGMPVVGLAGFIISGILALRLVFSIMRHGKF
jgi:ubiquinone biosynthesis protein